MSGGALPGAGTPREKAAERPTTRARAETDWLQELRRRGAVLAGHFRLSSSRHSDTYLQCSLALQDPGFALQLGQALAHRLRRAGLRPDAVAAPAIGGILAGFAVASALDVRFIFTERDQRAMVLRRGQQVAAGERLVVVEDVLTTGGSALESAAVVTDLGAEVVGFAALVDRSTPEHPLPFTAHALVRVTPRTWPAHACPLCAAGQPFDTPGSRPG